ncbi:MAG: CCA tRNA nucleotidyltransferase [Alphaproteobacteria bacterium]|nr:CCA tRNA nucleotidyltransferase [Alphaproteobacteria bacterium]
MTAAETRAVTGALMRDAGEARFVGGVVRNALLHRPVSDVDLATPLLPQDVMQRLEAAGIGAVPTGIEHGTVTAIANGKTFEITTLRRDVSTDGRRATVDFGTEWKEDAARRDFTMNALYATLEGEVFDYFGGLADLQAGRVRFVGDPATRICEDYLRILRLFRFHAWYGRGDIDAAALQAAAAQKSGLAILSGERIQKEMLKVLEAENPSPVLRIMAAAGILVEIMAGDPNLRRLENLVQIDRENFFDPDSLLRLAAMLSEDREVTATFSDRLKLSNAARERLRDLASPEEKIVSYLSIREVRKLLYRLGTQRFKDCARLRWAEDPKYSNAVQWRALLAMADAWQRPVFPITGGDVMAAGVAQGPLVGRILAEVEEWWIDSDFTEDEFSLAERLKAVVQAIAY